MKTYGYINNGILQEVIPPAVYDAEHPDWVDGDQSRIGLEIPIEERFTSEFISSCVDITNIDPMPQANWIYSGGTFSAPPAPGSSPAEILASQSAKLQSMTQMAAAQKSALTNRVGTLNDAIELEMATPDEEAELPVRVLQLKAWKTYAVLLGRVTSQDGWPPEAEWPVQPAEGMDLTVSAVGGNPAPTA